MTNAEMLVHDLSNAKDDGELEALVDYIGCPNSHDCNYDGSSNHKPCVECKIKWLKSKWE